VCLDTDILVGLLKGEEEAIEVIGNLQSGGHALSTTIVTAYELLKGSAISDRSDENLVKVRTLLSSVRILALDLESCEEGSRIYSRLRKKGQTIGEFDVLIAATVISNEESLVSRDNHFSLIENLNVQKW
jgi:tRNA(fMet)-specific endonuclease VapC